MFMIKDGAVICGNKYINAMMVAAQTVFGRHNWATVVTSGRDSHVDGYHPQDRALDFRCSMIPEGERQGVAGELRAVLPKFYDIVYEPEVSKVVDGVIVIIKGAHFHVEADAKKEKG